MATARLVESKSHIIPGKSLLKFFHVESLSSNHVVSEESIAMTLSQDNLLRLQERVLADGSIQMG